MTWWLRLTKMEALNQYFVMIFGIIVLQVQHVAHLILEQGLRILFLADGVRAVSWHKFDIANKFLKTLTLHWISALGGCSMSKLSGDVTAVSFLIRYCLDFGIPPNNIFSTPDTIDFLTSRASTTKQTGIFLGKIQRIADTATALSNNMFWQ